jgi:hypothetical protein
MDIYSKAKDWLKKMNLKFEELKKEKRLILLANYNNMKYIVQIANKRNAETKKDWICTYVLLLGGESLPSDKKTALFTELLLQNYLVEDLTYSIDLNHNVYSENDSPINTNYDSFKSEFKRSVEGIKIFNEQILSKVGLKMEESVMGTIKSGNKISLKCASCKKDFDGSYGYYFCRICGTGPLSFCSPTCFTDHLQHHNLQPFPVPLG